MILVHDEDDTPKAAALRNLRTLVADRDFVARMIDAAALTARDEGATWFLAPRGNCDEVVDHVPDGMTVVSVETLAEAYDAVVAIGAGQGATLPGCS